MPESAVPASSCTSPDTVSTPPRRIAVRVVVASATAMGAAAVGAGVGGATVVAVGFAIGCATSSTGFAGGRVSTAAPFLSIRKNAPIAIAHRTDRTIAIIGTGDFFLRSAMCHFHVQHRTRNFRFPIR